MYDIKTTAEMLALSPRTIRSMIARGDIQAYKFGKEFRIKKEELEIFITKSEV